MFDFIFEVYPAWLAILMIVFSFVIAFAFSIFIFQFLGFF